MSPCYISRHCRRGQRAAPRRPGSEPSGWAAVGCPLMAGWLDGWLAGWLAGWLPSTHPDHAVCDAPRSCAVRVTDLPAMRAQRTAVVWPHTIIAAALRAGLVLQCNSAIILHNSSTGNGDDAPASVKASTQCRANGLNISRHRIANEALQALHCSSVRVILKDMSLCTFVALDSCCISKYVPCKYSGTVSQYHGNIMTISLGCCGCPATGVLSDLPSR